MRKILPILFCFVLLFLTGCSASGCYENHSALPLAEFYSAQTGQPVSVSNVNIGGVGAPNDSLLVSAGSTASEVYLPFRASAESTSFYIEYVQENGASAEDIVTFHYTSIPFFAGEACGALYNYKVEKVETTGLLLEKVELLDSLITNVDRVYIRFYFNTSSGDEDEPETIIKGVL